MDCAENNIFHDGNVFECQLFDVRSNSAGGCGFKAVGNSGGIPGETRFYGCTFDAADDRGIHLEGGGTFGLFGVTSSYNANEGLYVDGVNFAAFDLQLERNDEGASGAGDQALIQAIGPIISRCTMTVIPGATGNGLKLVSTFGAQIHGLVSNSSAAGTGYNDIYVDDACRTATISSYFADDFAERVYLGSHLPLVALGGHVHRTGRQWFTGQSHAQIAAPLNSGTPVEPDARKADSFIFAVGSGSAAVTIANPLRDIGYHDGQRLLITVANDSGGAITVTWGAEYLMSAYTAPANAKRKTILFEWQGPASKWVQIGAASPDL
jgi:hypothetical protein